MSALRDAALTYAARGWRVFPCLARSKAPAVAHGFYDATTNPDDVARWWARWPSANVATPTGDAFDVVDFDELAAFERVELEHGCPGPHVVTSRGRHWYIAPTGNGCRKISDRIDFKGRGGYVLLPPSQHPTGARYRWARRGELQPAPDWLAALLTPPARPPAPARPTTPATSSARAAASLRAMHDRLASAPEGNRNALLFWCAVHAADTGVDRDDVATVLTAAATSAGLPDREITATLRSAFARWPS